jgi:transcription termination factor Rho
LSVLERSALAESPLADLHAIATELGIDGFRRLRKEELIDAIVARQGGNGSGPAATTGDEEERSERPRRRRGGRNRDRDRDEAAPAAVAPEAATAAGDDEEDGGRRRRRGGRGRDRDRDERRGGAEAPKADAGRAPKDGGDAEGAVEGVLDLLGNGSGFLRLSAGGEAADGDVYVSAAQVRRCELVAGDRVGGPVRPPRRSERHPSLVRVDTINGRAAEEAADGTRFDELPAAFPTERFAFDATEPTVKAIEWLTPIGKGSRVTIVGAARAGKSETLRRLGEHLARLDGLELSLVLAGVRPEEIAEAADGPVTLAAGVSFAASGDALSQAVERAVDNGKKIAARGGDAVVLIDTLDGVHPGAARKALAAARNVAGGGSLTVIATASAPLGGETTVVALDPALVATRHFPAIDLPASGTLRTELLLGDAGAEAIAEARAEAARS